MRPRRVEVEGFSAFRDRTVVEFDDTDLVAFVGPTGSGKSSIIDALTFALYGSVARYDDVRLVHPVINQGVSEAKVRLDFELAGVGHVAVRIVRRTKTGATTKEARLERDDPDDPNGSIVLASGAKEVTAAVEDLLGLDFTQFTRTVVLPQGDFAEFLKDDPASRQRLLRRLLDLEIYSRMGTLARERAKASATRAETLAQQLERHADVTPERLAAATAHRDGLEAFAEQATEMLADVERIETELVQLRDAVGVIDRDLERLASIAIPEAVADQDERLTQLRAVVAEGRARLDAARKARDEAERDAVDAGEPATLTSRLDAKRRLAAIEQELERHETLQTQLAASRTEALASVETAEVTRDRAESDLAAVRSTADAGRWVATLVVGEPCPVCRQNVGSIPEHDPDAELAAATASAEQAVAAWKEARRIADRAGAEAAKAEATIDQLRTEQAAMSEVDDDLKVEDLERGVQAALAAANAVAAAVAEVRTLEAAIESAGAQLDAHVEGERSHRMLFGTQRDSVAALTPPAPNAESLLIDWQALVDWAAVRVAELGRDRAKIGDDGKKAAEAKKERLDALTIGAAPFELDMSDLPAELTKGRAEAAADVARISDRLEEMTELRTQLSATEESRKLDDALGRQLSASGFERWLLAEALDDLVDRATVWLLDLSGGQFSLASDDAVFAIIDHRNADQHRDVRTLSGGETFLASLALALALSDSIAELAPAGSPRLDSMFLDEGFGTLDPGTLDVVASAIEELSAAGRLVGIVTHIEALAERMPTRFVVSKGPVSSSVERQTR